jgi:hypothetical protein
VWSGEQMVKQIVGVLLHLFTEFLEEFLVGNKYQFRYLKEKQCGFSFNSRILMGIGFYFQLFASFYHSVLKVWDSPS